MGKQLIGLHVSAAGGASNAPDNAKEVGAECFQFFSRSPRGGAAPAITDAEADSFKAKCRQYHYESYIHAPYYVNFASNNKHLARLAAQIIIEELERGTKLGVKYLMTHLGSAWDWPAEPDDARRNGAIKQVIEGLRAVYAKKDFDTELLLELAAGAGSIIGDTFDEMAFILKEVGQPRIGICLDTCHIFTSGYDLRSPEAVRATMKEFDKKIGLSRLKLAHANDSKSDLGSHRDLHEHISRGKIGRTGFQAILRDPAFRQVNFILETKHDKLIGQDLKLLKELRPHG